jgi:hypothetical protein
LKLSGRMINGRAVRINDANDKKNWFIIYISYI